MYFEFDWFSGKLDDTWFVYKVIPKGYPILFWKLKTERVGTEKVRIPLKIFSYLSKIHWDIKA